MNKIRVMVLGKAPQRCLAAPTFQNTEH